MMPTTPKPMAQSMADVRPVCTAEEVVALQSAVEDVAMEDSVAGYLLRLAHATRGHASVRLGASMRGALAFARMPEPGRCSRAATSCSPKT
jgi:MoxR-like ATPase